MYTDTHIDTQYIYIYKYTYRDTVYIYVYRDTYIFIIYIYIYVYIYIYIHVISWDMKNGITPLSQSTPASPNDGFRLIGHQRWGNWLSPNENGD